jgi:hypothetical protein
MTEVIQHPNGYTIQDFIPIVEGKVVPPNVATLTNQEFIAHIAAIGHSLTPIWGYALTDGRKQWTQFFLHLTEGWGYAASYPCDTYRFSICVHEKVLRPTDRPNHMRGWHPGICKLCGMSMDVDSSD